MKDSNRSKQTLSESINNSPLRSKQTLSEPIDNPPLVCPDCSERLSIGQLDCQNCPISPVKRNGIVSLQPTQTRSPQWLSDRERAEFAHAVANGPIRDAVHNVLDGHEHRSAILTTLFDVQQELWQPIAAEHITGRCLDLHAGYGRRSMVLAEYADSVYAADPSMSKLRIATNRDDYNSSSQVFPIHTSADQVPFPNGWFDTIFADLTACRDIPSKIARLREILSDDGSLLFLADGWPRNGITDLLGLGQSDSSPRTASGYQSLVRESGFEYASIYVMFPTTSRPLYAFDIECRHAIPEIFERYANENGLLGEYIKKLMEVLNNSSILQKCYPSFLVVCSNDQPSVRFQFDNPLIISGRTRSTVLDLESDGVSEIHKIPNNNIHGDFTERENNITYSLCAEDQSFESTIPRGEKTDSQFGPVRKVDPVEGQSLREETGHDPDSLERILEIGFDWLVDFQLSYRSETITRSPVEVRADLQFEPIADLQFDPADIEPPRIEAPVTTFTTPVHGDFLSKNIYYENDEVTSVIDWEYGAFDKSPVVDAGQLVLNTASWLDGDFAENVRTVLCSQNEYNNRARGCIRDYCDAVGLPYRTFELYLPTAYLHQLRIDWQLDAASTYLPRIEEHLQRVQIVLEEIEDMNISGS